jgi:probable rRNA maturation factor
MSAPTVFAYDEQNAEPVDLDRWTTLAQRALVAEGIAEGELTLAFVTEDDMAELNEEHMGESYATDVLSFPLDSPALGSDGSTAAEVSPGAADGAPTLLGDVIVCPAVAARNAPEHAGTYDDELALLIVHGVLHVLGHDHLGDSDTAQMQARELDLLQVHHWSGAAPASFLAHQRTP